MLFSDKRQIYTDDHVLLSQFEQKVEELVLAVAVDQLRLGPETSDDCLLYNIEMVSPSLTNANTPVFASQNASFSVQELSGHVSRPPTAIRQSTRSDTSGAIDIGLDRTTMSATYVTSRRNLPGAITTSPAVMRNAAQSSWFSTPTTAPALSETTFISRRSTWETDSATHYTPNSAFSFPDSSQPPRRGYLPSTPVNHDQISDPSLDPYRSFFDAESSKQRAQAHDGQWVNANGPRPMIDVMSMAPPNSSQSIKGSSFGFDDNLPFATNTPYTTHTAHTDTNLIKGEDTALSMVQEKEPGDLSLSCPLKDCPTKFTGQYDNQISNLTRHMKEIHGDRRRVHVCYACPESKRKSFGRPSNLKQHLDKIHNIKPIPKLL